MGLPACFTRFKGENKILMKVDSHLDDKIRNKIWAREAVDFKVLLKKLKDKNLQTSLLMARGYKWTTKQQWLEGTNGLPSSYG